MDSLEIRNFRELETKGEKWDHRPNFVTRQNNAHEGYKSCDRFHYGKCLYEGKPKCTGCGKPSHVVRYCHGNKVIQKANYAKQIEETGHCSMLAMM